jgi:hypothetical protein
MHPQSHEANSNPAKETHTDKRPTRSDEFSAQFGAEGLSLKMSLPKWAKTVLAILLAVGLLESLVVVKAIEIHDRYEQSQVAHNRLVSQLTEQVRKAEEAKRQAEQQTQAAVATRAFQRHSQEQPSDSKWLELPSGRGSLGLSVFSSNGDVLISYRRPDGTIMQQWLEAHSE